MVAVGLSVDAPPASATSPGTSPSTIVAVDTTAHLGTVDKAALGQAYLWPFGGMDSFDEQAGEFYPSFLQQLAVVQPGSLRYPGGITAEAFHWQRAVGPMSERTDNAFSPSNGPSRSSVGPDEFGALLDATKAEGVVTANFGTGSAAEAAGFVAYLTGAPGSSPWADMRVRNGHSAPYDVPYWEVGNEAYSTNYWRTGKPVTVGGPAGACQNVATCLYIYGGSTSFTNQAVVGYADRTAGASVSTGAAGQDFFVAYPPVAAGGTAVLVGGTAWTRVDSIADAGPDDHVYTLDADSGQVEFGDGVHGAVPPGGAKVTATYVSGPHDGFVDFYQQMKAANPAIKVCSTDTTDDFIASMGATLPYDCLQHHTYTQTSTVANTVPIDAYQDQMMAGADNEAATVAALQAQLRANAGRDIPLVETEYGQLLSSNPNGYPDYHESLDEALLNATQLANFLRLGIPVADRQLLAAAIPPDTDCCAGLPGAAPYASTASIGTPGPDTVLEATGELYQLFAPLAGGTVLGVQTLGSPVLPAAPGTPALTTLAVRTPQALYVVGINRSTTQDVNTRLVLPGVQTNGRASYTRLNGPSSLSYNTAAAPDTVTVTSGEFAASGNDMEADFPAHSVTALRLPVHTTPPQGLSLTFGDTGGTLIAPGSTVTLHATVTNTGADRESGHVDLVAPDGWAITPASARYNVAGNSSSTIDIQVTVPADAAEAAYTLNAVLIGPDRSADGVAVARTIVRRLGDWNPVATDTFDDQQAGAAPTDYTVRGPAGGVSVQPSPSGPGQVLQLQRPPGGTGLVSADRAVDPITGASRFVFRAWASQTNTALGVQLLDAAGNPVVKFTLTTGGDVAWSDPSDFVRGASYTSNTWHTYEMDQDPASGTYRFYIDDVLTATPHLNTAAGPVADIHLQIPASPATPGTFDLDDISVSLPAT